MLRTLLAAVAALCILVDVRNAGANPTHATMMGPGTIQVANIANQYFIIQGAGDETDPNWTFDSYETINSDLSIWYTITLTGDANVTLSYVIGPLSDVVPAGWHMNEVETGFSVNSGSPLLESLAARGSAFCFLSAMTTPGGLRATGSYAIVTYDYNPSNWTLDVNANGGTIAGSATCLQWPFSGVVTDAPDTVDTAGSPLCTPGQPFHCVGLPSPSDNLCALTGIVSLGEGGVFAYGDAEAATDLVMQGGPGTDGIASCLYFDP
jgi:hypothetical protein